MSVHDFCRIALSNARTEAKEKGVDIPKRITAIESAGDQYFVEMDGHDGVYVKGDCAWDAKARFIGQLIDSE